MRQRLIQYEQNFLAPSLTQRRAIEELEARAPAFTSSAVKLTGALNQQEADELLVSAMGMRGVGWEGNTLEQQECLKPSFQNLL